MLVEIPGDRHAGVALRDARIAVDFRQPPKRLGACLEQMARMVGDRVLVENMVGNGGR